MNEYAAFCLGFVTCAICLIGLSRDWPSKWIPAEDVERERRRRYDALASAGDRQIQEMR